LAYPCEHRRPLLETRGLRAGYGGFQALFGINLAVARQSTLAIIGANGAGKSTFLRAITGLISVPRDAVIFDGEPIGGLTPSAIMKRGIAMVPEGRQIFPSLSVEENLLIGAWGRKGQGRWRLNTVYELFPVLAERRRSAGTTLSGGQQQMLAIARALMSNPRLILCDEISLGLAPMVIRDIYAALPLINAEGSTMVLVDQDVVRAMEVADWVVCFQEGRLTLEGSPAELTHKAIHHAYFES
jgi:branched-chain amino acid transport system ATP-binding protein